LINIYRTPVSGVFRRNAFWFRGLGQKPGQHFAVCGRKAAWQTARQSNRSRFQLGPDPDRSVIPKKGTHSVGVAPQYASALGKTSNCQTLVSLTLARGEVPVVLALRLFLPESWTSKRSRLERAQAGMGKIDLLPAERAQLGRSQAVPEG
jgi:SRSO17 transposase